MKSQTYFWLQQAVKKISTIVYPRELEESTYEEIIQIIKKNIRSTKKKKK